MECPNCGENTPTLRNNLTGDTICAICGFSTRMIKSVHNSIETKHNFDKIEPLIIKINFADLFSNDSSIEKKINEIIEQQNKIVEYLNNKEIDK